MILRDYDPSRDKTAAHRIWYETGWLEKGKEEEMDIFVESGRAMVAEIGGEAECLVLSAAGTMRYLDRELPFTGVTGVTTSHVARKQGLASRLTASLVAADAADGALVAGLGMFEQGFYNQLGFGTGSYEHWVGFDPARLCVQV
jgi:predicted acetyltransferase